MTQRELELLSCLYWKLYASDVKINTTTENEAVDNNFIFSQFIIEYIVISLGANALSINGKRNIAILVTKVRER